MHVGRQTTSPLVRSSLLEALCRGSTADAHSDVVVYWRLLVAFLAEPEGDAQELIKHEGAVHRVDPVERAVVEDRAGGARKAPTLRPSERRRLQKEKEAADAEAQRAEEQRSQAEEETKRALEEASLATEQAAAARKEADEAKAEAEQAEQASSRADEAAKRAATAARTAASKRAAAMISGTTVGHAGKGPARRVNHALIGKAVNLRATFGGSKASTKTQRPVPKAAGHSARAVSMVQTGRSASAPQKHLPIASAGTAPQLALEALRSLQSNAQATQKKASHASRVASALSHAKRRRMRSRSTSSASASASSSAIRGIPKEAGLRRGHQHRVPGRRDHQGQGYPGRVRASQARHPRSLLLPRGLPEKLDCVMDFCTQCQIKKATERRGFHIKCEHQQSCISALHCHPKAI